MSLDDDTDGKPDVGAVEPGGIHHGRRTPHLMANSHSVPETPFRLLGTRYRLTDKSTPLYAKPDGRSDIVQQLSSGTVVTFNERAGGFARVATEGNVGYISTSTHVARTDTV